MQAILLFLSGVTMAIVAAASGEESSSPSLGALPELSLSEVSAQDANPLAAKALAIHAEDWKHGETDHFIYHFVHSYVATPISVEAEFHFRVTLKELGRAALPAETAKSHIYIFENPEDWRVFQSNAQLEPWTGGIHSRGSLFIVRDPAFKFADHSLGHEVVHLMLYRLYERPLPRWIDEGFAEYASKIAHASYQRARHYAARPRWTSLARDRFIPLSRLITMDYPSDPAEVEIFYGESERLVRYLITCDRAHFLALLDDLGRGGTFDTALPRHYGASFSDVAALEQQFLSAAANDSSALSGL